MDSAPSPSRHRFRWKWLVLGALQIANLSAVAAVALLTWQGGFMSPFSIGSADARPPVAQVQTGADQEEPADGGDAGEGPLAQVGQSQEDPQSTDFEPDVTEPTVETTSAAVSDPVHPPTATADSGDPANSGDSNHWVDPAEVLWQYPECPDFSFAAEFDLTTVENPGGGNPNLEPVEPAEEEAQPPLVEEAVFSYPENDLSPTADPLPPGVERVSERAAPVLANSANSGVPVNFVVNGKVHRLAPGEELQLEGIDAWVVRFDRGGTFGVAQMTLYEGRHEFRVSRAGWELQALGVPDTGP
jgi:hypothetical protein